MQDNYYNYMLEQFLKELREMVTINEQKTMIQYKTIDIKKWQKIEGFVEGLNEYGKDSKVTKPMRYYSDKIYPVLKSGEIKKFGFKKLFAIKIDDFDFRLLLSNCQSLIH